MANGTLITTKTQNDINNQLTIIGDSKIKTAGIINKYFNLYKKLGYYNAANFNNEINSLKNKTINSLDFSNIGLKERAGKKTLDNYLVGKAKANTKELQINIELLKDAANSLVDYQRQVILELIAYFGTLKQKLDTLIFNYQQSKIQMSDSFDDMEDTDIDEQAEQDSKASLADFLVNDYENSLKGFSSGITNSFVDDVDSDMDDAMYIEVVFRTDVSPLDEDANGNIYFNDLEYDEVLNEEDKDLWSTAIFDGDWDARPIVRHPNCLCIIEPWTSDKLTSPNEDSLDISDELQEHRSQTYQYTQTKRYVQDNIRKWQGKYAISKQLGDEVGEANARNKLKAWQTRAYNENNKTDMKLDKLNNSKYYFPI